MIKFLFILYGWGVAGLVTLSTFAWSGRIAALICGCSAVLLLTPVAYFTGAELDALVWERRSSKRRLRHWEKTTGGMAYPIDFHGGTHRRD